MGGSITFDDSLWPLLIFRFEGSISDSEFEKYLAQGTAYLRRGERHVNLVDTSHFAMPTAAQRQRQAEWLKAHEALLHEHLLGCALLVTSPWIRLALSSIFHLKPLPAPHVVVPDLAAGLKWTTTRLEEAGLSETVERIRGSRIGLAACQRARGA